jgi:glutamyl-tRNA reductase
MTFVSMAPDAPHVGGYEIVLISSPKIDMIRSTDNIMTNGFSPLRHLHSEKNKELQPLKIIAFTHHTTPLNELGRFFIAEDKLTERLNELKLKAGIDEILYLATCNRIEFVFTHPSKADKEFLQTFFRSFNASWNDEEVDFAVQHASVFEGEEAVRHLFCVASSLDSMVIGEREIITQVRNAFERCKAAGLTGDFLRLLIKNTITTAKQVYTDTRIADNPVSVVSLAFRKLKNMKVQDGARIVVIGAGETNSNLCKYLFKHSYRQFVIFNRTLSKAEKIAEDYNSQGGNVTAYPLAELKNFKNGFDVLITCTGSADIIVTEEIYSQLLNGDTTKKVVIDLAIPADVDTTVMEKHSLRYIGINELREEAERNLSIRQSELSSAQLIIEEGLKEFNSQARIRELELKMRDVPQKIREIKAVALNEVFAGDIESLDEPSRLVLSRVLDYMEKKYISVPMIMAKEIILGESN